MSGPLAFPSVSWNMGSSGLICLLALPLLGMASIGCPRLSCSGFIWIWPLLASSGPPGPSCLHLASLPRPLFPASLVCIFPRPDVKRFRLRRDPSFYNVVSSLFLSETEGSATREAVGESSCGKFASRVCILPPPDDKRLRFRHGPSCYSILTSLFLKQNGGFCKTQESPAGARAAKFASRVCIFPPPDPKRVRFRRNIPTELLTTISLIEPF